MVGRSCSEQGGDRATRSGLGDWRQCTQRTQCGGGARRRSTTDGGPNGGERRLARCVCCVRYSARGRECGRMHDEAAARCGGFGATARDNCRMPHKQRRQWRPGQGGGCLLRGSRRTRCARAARPCLHRIARRRPTRPCLNHFAHLACLVHRRERGRAAAVVVTAAVAKAAVDASCTAVVGSVVGRNLFEVLTAAAVQHPRDCHEE